LWQVFDWTTKNDSVDRSARVILRKKLATAILRLALTKSQIESLPANLSPADGVDAPPNFADARECWISIGLPGSTPVAEAHMKVFGGRSAFGVFIQHPEGSQAALMYLRRLAAAPYSPSTQPSSGGSFATDAAPQFPAGTKLALLRRMMLIDRDGQLVCSPIVESIQMRTFLKIEPRFLPEHVRMQEFVLDRNRYLAGDKNALHTVGSGDREPTVFFSLDIDWFEASVRNNIGPYRQPGHVLGSCIGCHSGSGVMSMESFNPRFILRARNPGLENLSFDREIRVTADWKQQQTSWGMLRGYWEATER